MSDAVPRPSLAATVAAALRRLPAELHTCGPGAEVAGKKPLRVSPVAAAFRLVLTTIAPIERLAAPHEASFRNHSLRGRDAASGRGLAQQV